MDIGLAIVVAGALVALASYFGMRRALDRLFDLAKHEHARHAKEEVREASHMKLKLTWDVLRLQELILEVKEGIVRTNTSLEEYKTEHSYDDGDEDDNAIVLAHQSLLNSLHTRLEHLERLLENYPTEM